MECLGECEVCKHVEATIDVAPVVHARWKHCYEDWRQQLEGDECSACGFRYYGLPTCLYCPSCGAKMDVADEQLVTNRDQLLAGCKQTQAHDQLWIPVEESLPESGRVVFVYLRDKYRKNCGFTETDFRENGDWWYNKQDHAQYEISHWMKLPEPPKEE